MEVGATLLLAGAIVLAGGLVQGTLGFGFSMVALPVMALLMPAAMPQLLVLLGTPLVAWVLWRDWSHVEWPTAGWLLLGRGVGVVPGAVLITLVTAGTLDVIFGLAGLLAVGALFAPGLMVASRVVTVLMGLVSGAMGTTSGIAGPPLVAIVARFNASVQRATLSAVFLGGNVITLAGLTAVGRVRQVDLAAAVALLAPLAVGAAASRVLLRFAHGAWLRWAVIGLCVVASLAVVGRGLVDLLGSAGA